MPVTAKLSKAFYDRFGEEVVAELVEWFNLVDNTYRADLRELNELNFARFDAKLEQRIVQLEARIDRKIAELEAKIDRKIAELDAKIDKLKTELEAKMTVSIAAAVGELRKEIHDSFMKQNRFLYLAWMTQMAAILSLWAR